MREGESETNIFGESVNKSQEPHEPNIFEQAAEQESDADKPHEPNIFEQAQTEQAEEPESEPEPEPESEPEPAPEPEPELEPEPLATLPTAQPLVGAGHHNIDATSSTTKKKKSKKPLVIILLIIVLAAAGGIIAFLLLNNQEAKAVEHEKKTPAPIAYTAASKLEQDYKVGAIDRNTYFRELYYAEYEQKQLDQKYRSDTGALNHVNNIDTLLDLVEDGRKEIDEKAIQDFAIKYSMADVAFGEETNAVSSLDVRLAATESYAHRLTKVISSEKGNFLVWYTTTGDDAITDEQAKTIANDLETNIATYAEMTGVPYSFKALLGGSYTGEMSDTISTLLQNSNVHTSQFYNAMSVYVFDTGSEGTLASYYHASASGVAADLLNMVFNIRGNRGVAAWPHIVVNKRLSVLSDGTVQTQVMNHELYHHYQVLICSVNQSANTDCPQNDANGDYTEALANYASSKTSGVGTFLNDWAGVYYSSNTAAMKNIYNPGGTGYGQYPYYYSYDKILGFENLVKAQRQENPYQYLQDQTSRSDLVDVINDTAYRSLAHDFDGHKEFTSDTTVQFENDGDYSINYDNHINAGARHYYILGKDWSLKFKTSSEYCSGLIIGKNGDKYKVLKTENGDLSAKSTDFSGYETYYFAATNAHLIDAGDYHIEFELKDAPGTLTFNHKYQNYAVKYTMNMEIGGIKVKADGEGVVDELHQREYLNTTMTTLMNMQIKMTTYSDFYNGIDYTSNPVSGLGGGLGDIVNLLGGGDSETPAWTKTNTASHTIDIDFVVKRMIKADQAQKIDDNHYKLKMTAGELKELMSTANNASEDSDYKVLNGEVEVDVYIDKYGRISKLVYDFSSLVSGVDKFDCTMELSKYNEAGDVVIPPSIVAGAVEQSSSK